MGKMKRENWHSIIGCVLIYVLFMSNLAFAGAGGEIFDNSIIELQVVGASDGLIVDGPVTDNSILEVEGSNPSAPPIHPLDSAGDFNGSDKGLEDGEEDIVEVGSLMNSSAVGGESITVENDSDVLDKVNESITESNDSSEQVGNESVGAENNSFSSVINESTIALDNLTKKENSSANVSFDFSAGEQVGNVFENETVNNSLEEIFEEEDFTVEIVQGAAEVGQPVRWTKKVYNEGKKVNVKIPKEGKEISYKESDTGTYIATSKKSLSLRSLSVEEVRDIPEVEEVEQGHIEVVYETAAPNKEEKILKNGKEVLVYSEEHYTNVIVSTEIDEALNVRDKREVVINWVEEGVKIQSEKLEDRDENGIYDYVSWDVPHLSNQTFQIIVINLAEHLDVNRNYIEDIYSQVEDLDGVYSPTINDGEFVRITFERELDKTKDITIYPKVINGTPWVEVYEKDGEVMITKFDLLKDDVGNKIYLSGLLGVQDTYDLKVVNGSVQFDYIVDPTATYNSTFGAPYCSVGDSPCVAPTSLLIAKANMGGTAEPNSPNTVDACTDGTSAGTYASDESVENITVTNLGRATFEVGDTIQADIWVYCYGATDNVNVVYSDNAQSPIWTIVGPAFTCAGAGYELVTRNIVLSSRVGDHVVRGVMQYNGNAADTCGNTQTWSDTDDLAFQVLPNAAPSVPTGLTCNGGSCDVVIDGNVQLNCSGSVDPEGDVVTYMVNDTNGNIGSHTGGSSFVWDTSLAPETTGVNFTCEAIDFWGSDSSLGNYTLQSGLTIDHTNPMADFASGTLNDGSVVNANSIFVNISIIEDNFENITFELYDGTGVLNSDTFTDSTRSVTWNGLLSKLYFYNVTVYDKAGHLNVTTTRNITIDTVNPSATLSTPTSNKHSSKRNQNLTADVSDALGLKRAALSIFNSSGSLINTTTVLVSGVVATVGIVYNFVSDGVYSWFYRVSDLADNVYDTTNNTITIDTIPSTIVLKSILNNSGDVDGVMSFKYNVSDVLSSIKNCSLIINNNYVLNDTIVSKGVAESLDYSGLPIGHYNFSVVCYDEAENFAQSEIRFFDVVGVNSFSGNTTDFSTVDLNDVSKFVLENPSYGKISYNQNLNLTGGVDFDSLVVIGEEQVGVNSLVEERMNRSATIEMYNLNYQFVPKVLKDGVICQDCQINSYAGGVLIFNVSSFSTYTLGANSKLQVSDTTEFKTVYPLDNVSFYANYSNLTTGQAIDTASCNISFEDEKVEMVYNASSYLFEYNRNFSTYGAYNYNVSCLGSAFGYEDLKTLNTIVVNFEDLGGSDKLGYQTQSGLYNFVGTDEFIPLDFVVDINSSFVLSQNKGNQENTTAGTSGDPATTSDTSFVSLYLYNSTHIRAQRGNAADGPVVVSWQVLEAMNGEFSVQREVHSYSGTAATTTATIPTPVNVANSMSWFYISTTYTGNNGDLIQFYSDITDANTITFTRGNSGTALNVDFRWVVVSWDIDKINNFAKGYTGAISGPDTAPDCFSIGKTINKSTSILFHQSNSLHLNTGGLDSSTRAGYIQDDNFVCFYDFDGINDAGVKWYVIDLSGATQREEGIHTDWASADYVDDVVFLSSFSRNRSLFFVSGTSNGDGTAKPRHTEWSGFNGGDPVTGIHIERTYGGQNREYAWQVLELPYDENLDAPVFSNPRVNSSFVGLNDIARFSIDVADGTDSIASVNGTVNGGSNGFVSGAGNEWYYDFTCLTDDANVDLTIADAIDDGYPLRYNLTLIGGVATACDAAGPVITFISPDTPLNDTQIGESYFSVNVSVVDANFKNVTFSLYDEMGLMVDNGRFTDTTRGYVFTGLSSGDYYYNVSAYDLSGQLGVSETRKINVDSENPLISFSGVTLADGLIVSGDTITAEVNVVEPNEANITFYLYDSSFNLASTPVAYTDKRRVLPWVLLADGLYYYNVTVYDIYGHSNSTETRTVTLDNGLPIVSYGEGVEADDSYFARNYIYVNVSYVEDNFENITFILSNQSSVISSQTFVDGTKSFNFTGLDDLEYYYNVTVYDKAGNLGNPATRKITLDNSAPVVDFGVLTEADNNNVSHNWVFVDGVVTEPYFSNVTFGLFDNFGNEVVSQTFSDSTRSFNFSGLSTGFYEYNISSYDKAGNLGNSVTRRIGVDVSGPSINIISPQAKAYGNGTNLLLNYSVTDLIAGVNTCWYNVNGGANATTDCLGSSAITVEDGQHTVYFYANDTFGNLGTKQVTFLVSTAGPAVTLNEPANDTVYSVQTLFDFNYSAVDPDGLDYCSLYGDWRGGWHLNQTLKIVAPWYNSSWEKRKTITIDSGSVQSSLTDFPFLVELYDEGLHDFTRSDGADILFTFSDGTTKLSYEMESFNQTYNSTHAHLVAWVKVNLSSVSDMKLFMYYNNSNAINQEDSAGVWNSNYSAVWHMTEINIQDSTANANDGTATSMDSTNVIGARIGSGINFVGSSTDYITTADTPFDFVDDFTISTWMQTTDASGDWAKIIDKLGRWTTGYGIGSKVNAYGFVGYWVSGWGGDPAASFGTVNDGSWHLITSVVEGGVARVYSDGILINTYSAGAGSTITTNDYPLTLGKSANTDSYWTGVLDEVQISSTPRSADWIATSYQNQESPESFYTVSSEEIFEVVKFSLNLDSEGNYKWNVKCNDSLSFIGTAIANYSVSLDLTNPIVDFGVGTLNDGIRVSQGSLYVDALVVETNLKNITFDLYKAGVNVGSQTYSDSTRNYTFTGLSDGIYKYNITVYDKAGRIGNSSTRSVEFDTTKPTGVSNTPGDGYFTKNPTQNLTATIVDSVELKDAMLYIYNSTGNVVFTSLVSLIGMSSATIGVVYTFLYDDVFSWFYRVRDSVDNEYNTTANSIEIDNTAPVITFIAATENDGVVKLQDNIFVNTSMYEKNYKNMTFGLFNDEGIVSPSPNTFSDGTRQINWTNLADDVYYYNVSSYDLAGNVGYSPTRSIILDNIAPMVSFTGATKVNDSVISGTSITVEVSVVEVNEANITFALYDSFGTLAKPLTTSLNGRRNVNWTLIPEGIYYYNVTVVDDVNLKGSTITRKITLDNTAPVVSFSAGTENDSGNKSQNWIYVNTSVVENNFKNITLRLFDNSMSEVSSMIFTDSTRAYNFTGVANGVYYYNVTVYDLAGQKGDTTTRKISLDTVKPVVNFVSPTESDLVVRNRDWIYVNTSVVEASFKEIKFSLYDSDGFNDEAVFTDSTRGYNFTSVSDGNYKYNVTVSDWAGNVANTSTRSIGLDGSGPIVNLIKPKSKTYGYNTSLPLEHTVSDTVSSVDACWWNLDGGTNQTIVCNTATIFDASVAPHTINFYANDTFGNLGFDSVSFFISVTGPAVELLAPANDTFYGSAQDINFSFVANDPDSVDTCSLYGDWAGAWNEKQVYSGDWFDVGYSHRQEVVLTNIGASTLTDFPAYLNISSDHTTSGDYNDLRFFSGTCDSAGAALSYEIEDYSESNGNIWVKISSFGVGENTICMYYGNSDAESDEDALSVWSSAYTSVYHLDQTSGVAYDSLGNWDAEDGITPDSNMNIAGVVGGADYFDGSDYLGTNPEWNVDGAHTYCTWAKFSVGHFGTILEDGGLTDGTGMGVTSTGEFRYAEMYNGVANFLDSGTSYSDNSWHYVCGGHTGSVQFLYVDGELSNSATQGDGLSGTDDARIGSANSANPVFNDNTAHGLIGSLDEIKVSSIDRSGDWINQSYQQVANSADTTTFLSEETFIAFSVGISSEGAYSWNVKCNDTIGYSSFGLDNYIFIMDVTSPVVLFGAGTKVNNSIVGKDWVSFDANVIENNFKNITFSLYDENGLTVDSRQFTDNTRVVNFTGLSSGDYRYNITVYDRAEHFGYSQTRYINLDLSPPTGILASPVNGGYVNNLLQNLTGAFADSTGLLNATLYVFNETGSLIYTSYQNLLGATSATVGLVFTFLKEGIYSWFYKVEDNVGNVYNTANNTLTVDTTKPLIDYSLGVENSGLVFGRENVYVNVTYNEIYFDNLTFRLYDSLGLLFENSFNDGTKEIDWALLPDGFYEYNVTAYDLAGNSNTTETRNITFDNLNPVVDFGAGTKVDGAYGAGDTVYVDTVVTEANEANITFNLYNATGFNVKKNTFSDGRRSISWNLLSEGTYYYNVTVVDKVSHKTSTSTRSIILDNTLPVITYAFGTENNDTSFARDWVYFNVNLVESNFKNVTLTLSNESSIVSSQSFSDTTREYNWTSLSDGTYYYNATTYDKAGNKASTLTRVLVLDNVAPIVDFGVGTLADGINNTDNWIYVNASVVEGNFNNITFRLFDRLMSEVSSKTFTNTTRDFNFTGLASAVYYYNISVSDKAGVVGNTTLRKSGLDYVGPVISLINPKAKAYGYNLSLPLDYVVTDAIVGNDVCWYNLDNGVNTTVSCSGPSNFNTSDGQHTLHFYANDTLGNMNYENVTFLISTTGPAIQLLKPADNVFYSSAQSVVFNYTAEDPDGAVACSLYGDWNGGWHLNQTTDVGWWNSGYSKRKMINITNLDSVVINKGYSMMLTMDTTGSDFKTNGEDVRIVYVEGSTSLELDRHNETAFNNVNTEIWFSIQASIAGFGSDGNYYVYYNNPTATNPPQNESNVFSVYDDFNDGTISNEWTSYNIQTGVGSTTEAGGLLAVSGQGADIWGAEDDQRLVSQPLNGDFIAEAELSSTTWATNAWGKASLIVKDAATQGTNYAMVGDTMGNGMGFQWNYAGNVIGAATSGPTLFRLIKSGSIISSYYSVDGGDTWNQLGVNQDIGVTDPVEIGFSSTSHTTTDFITAYWDFIKVRQLLLVEPTYLAGSEETFVSPLFYLNLSEEGTHYWNVECNDTKGYYTWAVSNYSITFDVTNPVVDFGLNTLVDNINISQNFIYVNSSIVENNYKNITFRLFDESRIEVTSKFFNDSTRDYTFTNLADGTYYYNMTVYDKADRSDYSPTRKIMLDTKAPTGSLSSPDSGVITNNANQNLTGNFADENGLAGVMLYIFNSTGFVYSSPISLGGTLSATVGVVYDFLVDGIYDWFYQAEDSVANLYNTTNNSITIDTTLPVVTFVNPTENSGVYMSQDFIYLNTTVNEINYNNITFNLFDSSANSVSINSFSNSKRDINWTLLPNDEYLYNVTVWDKAGNVNSSETRNITLDTLLPVVNYAGGVEVDSANKSESWVYVNTTVVDTNFANMTFILSNDTSIITSQTFSNGTREINWTGLVDGSYYYNVTVYDKAGHGVSLNTRRINLDTTLPVLSYTVNTEADGYVVERDWIFVETAILENNFKEIRYGLYDGNGLVNETVYNTPVTSINFTASSENKTYQYNVSAYDFAGNVRSVVTRNISLIDVTNPRLILESPQSTNYSYANGIRISYDAIDVHLDKCWYNLDGEVNITLPNCFDTSINVDDFSSHTLELYANDTMGYLNNTSATFFVNSSLIFTPTYRVISGTSYVDGYQEEAVDQIDMSKSFILHTARGGDKGADTLNVLSKFLDVNTIAFENYISGEPVFVEWNLVVGPNISVQRGELDFGSESYIDTSINAVNLSSSFIIVNSRVNSPRSAQNIDGMFSAEFLDDTTIRFSRGVNGSSGELSFQVVDWADISVQSGSLELGVGNSVNNAIINGVDLTKSFLVFSNNINGSNVVDSSMIRGGFETNNNISFERVGTAGNVSINYFVLESDLFDVQSGDYAHLVSTAEQDVSLGSDLINSSRAFNLNSHYNDGSATDYSTSSLTQKIKNNNTLALQKGANAGAGMSTWFAVEMRDLNAPAVELTSPTNSYNFSTYFIPSFGYSFADESSMSNCSLYGSWNGGWHLNQTVYYEVDFASVNVGVGGFYNWTVECYDIYGNLGMTANNTFGAFLPPTRPAFTNITQSANNGTGDIFIDWNASVDALTYRIYAGSDMGALSMIAETANTNYTDTTFVGQRRRFYKVEAWNPSSANISTETYGAHVYTLNHNVVSPVGSITNRNWISFPTNFTSISNANESLGKITGITSISRLDTATQKQVSCNEFSCPESFSCTDTACNFDLKAGEGYEVIMNTSGPVSINWSGVGIVNSPVWVDLVYDESGTRFNKNWIGMTASTVITSASELRASIDFEDAISGWDSASQDSLGQICYPFGPCIGRNFEVNMEEGFEVSMTEDYAWLQQ
jgi:hypothetical protein